MLSREVRHSPPTGVGAWRPGHAGGTAALRPRRSLPGDRSLLPPVDRVCFSRYSRRQMASHGSSAAAGRQSEDRRLCHPFGLPAQPHRHVCGSPGRCPAVRRQTDAGPVRHRSAGPHPGAGHQTLFALCRRHPPGRRRIRRQPARDQHSGCLHSKNPRRLRSFGTKASRFHATARTSVGRRPPARLRGCPRWSDRVRPAAL